MEVEFKLSRRPVWLDRYLADFSMFYCILISCSNLHTFQASIFVDLGQSLEIGKRLRGFFVRGEPTSLRSNPSSVVVRSGAFLVARLANGHPPGLSVPDLSGRPKQRTFLYYGVYSSKQAVTAVKFESNFLPQAYIFLA